MEENKEMNFFDHLEELRKRIVWSAIAVVSMAVVIFIYQEWIMDNIFKFKKSRFYYIPLILPIFGRLCN